MKLKGSHLSGRSGISPESELYLNTLQILILVLLDVVTVQMVEIGNRPCNQCPPFLTALHPRRRPRWVLGTPSLSSYSGNAGNTTRLALMDHKAGSLLSGATLCCLCRLCRQRLRKWLLHFQCIRNLSTTNSNCACALESSAFFGKPQVRDDTEKFPAPTRPRL